MIKGLMGSNGISVSGGNTILQYVNQNAGNPMQGMIRVWGTDMQVFDGTNWSNIASSYATVELDQETKNLLEWAKKRKLEEELLITMPTDHPAVRVAKGHLNTAKLEVRRLQDQLKITEILIQDDQSTS